MNKSRLSFRAISAIMFIWFLIHFVLVRCADVDIIPAPTEMDRPTVGLVNGKNLCFANGSLQALFAHRGLVQAIFDSDVAAEKDNDHNPNYGVHSIMTALRRTFAAMAKQAAAQGESLNLTQVYGPVLDPNSFERYFPGSDYFRGSDAIELERYLIENLSDIPKGHFLVLQTHGVKAVVEVGLIFGFTQVQDKVSKVMQDKLSDFNHLPFDTNITTALNQCKTIKSYPNILRISLQRLIPIPNDAAPLPKGSSDAKPEMKMQFLPVRVEFAEVMQIQREKEETITYDLFAVVVHTAGYHYFSYVKYGEQWYRANDTVITKVEWGDLQKEFTKFTSLFYAKRIDDGLVRDQALVIPVGFDAVPAEEVDQLPRIVNSTDLTNLILVLYALPKVRQAIRDSDPIDCRGDDLCENQLNFLQDTFSTLPVSKELMIETEQVSAIEFESLPKKVADILGILELGYYDELFNIDDKGYPTIEEAVMSWKKKSPEYFVIKLNRFGEVVFEIPSSIKSEKVAYRLIAMITKDYTVYLNWYDGWIRIRGAEVYGMDMAVAMADCQMFAHTLFYVKDSSEAESNKGKKKGGKEEEQSKKDEQAQRRLLDERKLAGEKRIREEEKKRLEQEKRIREEEKKRSEQEKRIREEENKRLEQEKRKKDEEEKKRLEQEKREKDEEEEKRKREAAEAKLIREAEEERRRKEAEEEERRRKEAEEEERRRKEAEEEEKRRKDAEEEQKRRNPPSSSSSSSGSSGGSSSGSSGNSGGSSSGSSGGSKPPPTPPPPVSPSPPHGQSKKNSAGKPVPNLVLTLFVLPLL